MDRVDQARMGKDYILKLFMKTDMTELNDEIRFLIKTCSTLSTASPRLHAALKMVLEDGNRSAKHALLAFAMYNDQTYRESLITRSKVNVIKFQNFYDISLKKETENLLYGRLGQVCLQAYIETVRHEYNMS